MTKQEFKSYRAEIKAAPNGDAGVVEAIVSVFGNIDLGGDRVVQGAFAKSLERWNASGDPIPFIWSHEWDRPEAHIGYVEQAEERPEGLWVRARLDIDRPFAEQVFHLMKTRRVTQFSFGYTVEDYAVVSDADGTTVRELKEVDVFEVGPTLLGMNPATQLLQAASALTGMKDAQDVSAIAEHLSVAHKALGDALSTLSTDEKTDLPTQDDIEVKAIDVPSYVADNAKRGLDYYEQGLGGDGLEPETIADARQMADGQVTEEKVRKIGPWIDRHIVDLDSPQNSNPDDPDYPGPGLVAMLLWGGGPDKDGAMRTRDWARGEADGLDTGAKSERVSEVVETSDAVSRDTEATIIPEEILDLLVRTRHSEE